MPKGYPNKRAIQTPGDVSAADPEVDGADMPDELEPEAASAMTPAQLAAFIQAQVAEGVAKATSKRMTRLAPPAVLPSQADAMKELHAGIAAGNMNSVLSQDGWVTHPLQTKRPDSGIAGPTVA